MRQRLIPYGCASALGEECWDKRSRDHSLGGYSLQVPLQAPTWDVAFADEAGY